MLKAWLSRCAIIFLSYSFIGLAHAYSKSTKSDPLQTYRDEIKQSETNASQAVLNALKANADPENVTQQNQTVSPTAKPTPRSNNDKAFIPDNTPANSTHSSDKNPWLQPNPWAKQPPNIWEKNAKINPYANAPIPGPTTPKVSANATTPAPPNIFAHSQPNSNINQVRPHANF
ncbi:hypothetical protein [Rickettsiella endosymbiont of Litargus connexus]|jgi:hypothetical protein|uniref:hypothetical protein n=1 Tax=Rickettsiella endosymbiont of Litargus connexus TaxID=3066237 RepID=UPI00376EEAA8